MILCENTQAKWKMTVKFFSINFYYHEDLPVPFYYLCVTPLLMTWKFFFVSNLFESKIEKVGRTFDGLTHCLWWIFPWDIFGKFMWKFSSQKQAINLSFKHTSQSLAKCERHSIEYLIEFSFDFLSMMLRGNLIDMKHNFLGKLFRRKCSLTTTIGNRQYIFEFQRGYL